MKTKWIVLIVAVLLAFPAGSNARASRDPLGGGTWIVRDPSPESDELLRFDLSTPGEMTVGPNLYQYCINNPIRYIDPLGLQAMDSVTNSVMQAMASGNAEAIQAAIDAGGDAISPELQAAARSAIQRLNSQASKIISKECKGSINQVFPGEMRDKTLQEINDLAKGGNKAAQTARKLLTDKRFQK